MKKLIPILALLFCFLFQPCAKAYAEEEVNLLPTYVVTANSASVYASPSLKSEKVSAFKNKDEVSLIMKENSPEIFTGDGFSFYKLAMAVVVDGKTYEYILSDLVTERKDVIVAIPNFNGKTNQTCSLFVKQDDKIVRAEPEITLQKGEQIFLYEGFNSKADYNAVAVLIDGQVQYGYLQTSAINPNGINPLIITTAFLILAVLGIVFTWVFMKRKKVNLKTKKIGIKS